jgi:hypothetical protein
MVTSVEAHFGWKWLLSAKNAFTLVFAYGKQIAMLETRVSALEAALAKQPADTCPFCGERAMRKTQDGKLWGGAKQWKKDFWTCQACKKTEVRVVHFS